MSGIIINPYSFGSAFSSTKSLAFDGVDDYVEFTPVNLGGYGAGEEVTVSFWIKRAATGNTEGILSATGANSGSFIYFIGTTSMNFTAYANSVFNSAATQTALARTDWMNVLFTLDSSNVCTLYIDGVLTEVGTGGPNSNCVIDRIGIKHHSSYPTILRNPFTGNLDEISGFKSKLGVSDIAKISAAPIDLDTALSVTPEVWYRMGENSTFKTPQILMPENTNKDKFSNYSMAFDGVNDYVDCGDSNDFSFGNGVSDSPFSVAFWVNLDAIPAAAGFFAKDYDATNREWTVGTFSGPGKIRFLIKSLGGGSQQSIDSTTVLSTGSWYYILCTYDGTGGNNAADGMNIYINGALETPTNITKQTYVAMSNTTAPVTIGRYQLGATPLGINGRIDEVSIFNSVKAIGDLWDGTGKPTDLSGESDLVGYWKMGEEAVFNTSWLLPNKAQDVFSRYSMAFDGVDDYINCGSLSNIISAAPFSVSLWFKQNGSGNEFLISGGPTGFGEFNASIYLRPADGEIWLDGSTGLQEWSWSNVNNNWQHLLFVDAGGGTFKLYSNGVSETLVTSTTFLGSQADLWIGGRTLGNYFDGNIDEVAFFNSDVSGDIATIWGGGTPADLTSLSPVAWWRMGEEATFSAVWTIPDQVGSNHGTSVSLLESDLVGEAPTTSGNGISDNMTIEDRTGDAPDSENNSLSYNMDAADIDSINHA